MATKYTVRITNDDGVIKAWIDMDGELCIEQPHAPGQPDGSTWASEDEALAWANKHATKLEEHEAGVLAAAEKQNALLVQAQEDSKKLTEIHDMLKELLSK